MNARWTLTIWPLAALSLAVSIGCEPAARHKDADSDTQPAAGPLDELLPPVAGQPAIDPQAGTVQKPADVGVGKRGRDLGQGPVATPVAAYFAAKEQIAFRVEAPQAMNLYKATNGRAPRSHDEFMREIIQANNIRLPELPEGHRYVYDPEQEQLMVEHPE